MLINPLAMLVNGRVVCRSLAVSTRILGNRDPTQQDFVTPRGISAENSNLVCADFLEVAD